MTDNSAAIACPVEDVQGDGRWMSMVIIYLFCMSYYTQLKADHIVKVTTMYF